ncbi:hypothetical protein B566_EDAN012964 [Ephemera danica]|nr:hypothetical protein B566_EDAN012964 [Ephemera danica]
MSSAGRSTGTVPKVKSRSNASSIREQDHGGGAPRRATVSNMPNNLQASSLEWQQTATQAPSSQSRARKPRNTRQPSNQGLFDGSFDLQLSHERLRPRVSDCSLRSLQSDSQMENERPASYEDKVRRCGDSGTSSQVVCNSRSHEQPHNTLLGTKNNISKIPDRNQVLSRLNQIRDYVKQTSALMDSLRGSSDPRHIVQVVKLSHMNADLRDSESRLEQLLNTLNSLADSPEPIDNCSTPEHLERFSQLLDIVKTQEDTCLGLFKDGVIPDALLSPQSPPNGYQSHNRSQMVPESLSLSHTSSRSMSEEPSPVPTAAQFAKHQELKLKMEESQKKLLALQEHHAALVALQHKAQQQLHEAQAQQGALLATSVDESPTSASVNMDNMSGRMQTLQNLLMNRNEVAHMLGEQDEELEVEHTVLQERLQELHGRKQAMDRLVHELKALGDADLVAAANGLESQVHENGVEHQDESSEEEEEEHVAVVTDKLEELNRMKSRLAQLQSMVTAVNRGDLPHETIKAALTDAGPRSEERETVARVQRTQRDSESSTKPDNIVLSAEGTPSYLEAQVMDIKMKTDQLNKAKKRLQQLKDMLGTVGITDDFEDGDEEETSGPQQQQQPQQSLTVEAAHALSRELLVQTQNIKSEQERLSALQQSAARVAQAASSMQHPTSNQAKNKNQDTSQQRTREGMSSRQLALQAELQAKRQELEELMHKDQGQSSSLNQDTCSETGFSLPETSATWGGSSSSQTALLATVDQEAEAQEQSLLCSSDDAVDEPMMDARTSTSQIPTSSRQRQQSLPPLPPNAGGAYQSWPQFRTKYDASRKDTPDSRSATPRAGTAWVRRGMSPGGGHEALGHDLQGSASSSGATPRPPSETGSTNTQSMPWWPLQVQQQLDATSAMCQAMMHQWQWGSPGPEPWWNMQAPMPPAHMHQQQQLMLSLSQCCHMLWMQHRELAALHATVQNLQERVACAERFGLAAAAVGATAGHPENTQAPPPAVTHQPLKVSLSTGVFPGSDQAAAAGATATPTASGVSSAHSLPNLCDGPLSLPQAPTSPYMLPPPHPTQYAWMAPPPHHNARSPTTAASPGNSGLPSLLRHGPPVTLNNQVPPGIRANNYWDNFRSYSRQNLLSASTKSNEGHLHNPSPIADRSHNSLRGAESQQAAASSSKLNTEQRQPATSAMSNPSASPVRQPSAQIRQPMSSPGGASHRSSSVLSQESLYSELSTLMAQNQSRPEFLPQLFRELQSLSCDTLCQQALQSIREISHTARVDSRNSQLDPTMNQMRPRSRDSHSSAPGDRDDMSMAGAHGISMSDAAMAQPLLEETGNSSESSPDSTEGATALPLLVSSTSNSGSRTSQRSMQIVPSLESCSMEMQDDGWNVEQDRDLDQVPTRLEPAGDNVSSTSQQSEAASGPKSGSPRP